MFHNRINYQFFIYKFGNLVDFLFLLALMLFDYCLNKNNFLEKYQLCTNLSKLKTKFKSSNEINEIYNFQTLSLFNNRITSIPSEIGQLINLLILYLFDNQITEIPLEILNLPNCQIYR